MHVGLTGFYIETGKSSWNCLQQKPHREQINLFVAIVNQVLFKNDFFKYINHFNV